MVFFIGLNVDVKIKISPFVCSSACSSLRPTTESGGMLQRKKERDKDVVGALGKGAYYYMFWIYIAFVYISNGNVPEHCIGDIIVIWLAWLPFEYCVLQEEK